MKIDQPENKNYCATVVTIVNLTPLDNCDNVVATSIHGFQAIVGKDTLTGDKGLIFTTETQLSDEFCHNNNLYRHAEKNKDPTHRLHHVTNGNKRWDKFFEELGGDSLRDSTHQLLLEYEAKGRPIIFVSARPERCRAATQLWLAEKGLGKIYWTLIMRPDNDSREDTKIKHEIYDRYFAGKKIETVIDDRPQVIRMWKGLGLPVIDVGKGVEF